MMLKRYYDRPENWERAYEGLEDFEALLATSALSDQQKAEQVAAFKRTARVSNMPAVIGVDVLHTGTTPNQNWSRDWVDAGVEGGWFTMSQGKVTLHTQTQGDLVYQILRRPGTYCCICDERLDDDPSGQSGRTHMQQMHPGDVSPDPNNPAGFKVVNGYECLLDEEAHAQWNYQAVQDAKGTEAAQGRTSAAPRRRARTTGRNGTDAALREQEGK